MESNNLRDVQRLTNQILSESTQAEEHFMDSWPYTAPYLEEQQAQMRSNVTDALPWNRNTKYTTQGRLRKPGENVHGQQTGRGLNTTTATMGAKPAKKPLANPGPMKNSSNAELGTKRSHPGAPGGSLGWNRLRKEEADLFDVLSEFLVSEGYSEQETLEMMVIMTEEQRNQILEGIIGQTADNIARGAGTVVGTAQRGIRAAKGLPGYLKQKAKNVKSTFDSARERASSNNPNVRSGRMTRSRTPSASPGTKSQKPNSSVSSPGYDTRRIGGYDLRRLPPN